MEFSTNSEWPPLPGAVTGKLKEWDRWYTGALDASTAAENLPGNVRRMIQSAGTSFWGRTPTAENPRRNMHMPIAHDICVASADLLFGEKLEIVSDERMQYVMDQNGADNMWLEAAEYAAAHGGVYIRIGWDMDVADCPLWTIIPADSVYPVWKYGRLAEAVIWTIVETDGGTVWRHLEHHAPGEVRHELWQGTTDSLGRKQPLTDHPATAGLAETDIVTTGADKCALVYVPNVRPNPDFRGDPVGHYMGRADVGVKGVDSFMDALDEAWTSWMRDLRLGKARIIVAASMLDSGGPGQGSSVNLDREVYESVRFAQGENATLDSMMSAQQFTIRHQEHAATVDALLSVIIRACGYSGSTFGIADDVARTATEVDSADRRSAVTRERKTRYWTTALEELLRTTNQIDVAQFGQAVIEDIQVAFPPTASPSQMDVAQSVQIFRAAQAMSIETAVKMAQPDLEEADVKAEVARIMEEAAPPPSSFDPYGGFPENQPADPMSPDANQG